MNAHNNDIAVVGNSVKMEKMSLWTLLEKFRNVGVSIRWLKADRHVQIRPYMVNE